MLATLWWPNTNPIGPASLWPLGIVIVLAAIQRRSRSQVLALAAPPILAILAVLSAGFPFAGYRRFPDADDFAGYYIWNLAACCFALETARSGSRGALIVGGVVIFPMGWLLVLEIVARSAALAEGTRNLSMRQIVLASSVVWCVLFSILILRAAQPYLRASRIARGLCAGCGYNLRESPERCPECGEAAAVRPAA